MYSHCHYYVQLNIHSNLSFLPPKFVVDPASNIKSSHTPIVDRGEPLDFFVILLLFIACFDNEQCDCW